MEEKETDFYKISVNEFFVFFVDGTGMSTEEKEKKKWRKKVDETFYMNLIVKLKAIFTLQFIFILA